MLKLPPPPTFLWPGFLGFSGAVLYVAKLGDDLETRAGISAGTHVLLLDKYHYSWSLGLNLCGCGLLLIAAVVLFISNDKPRSESASDTESLSFDNPVCDGAGDSMIYTVPVGPVLPPPYCPPTPPPEYSVDFSFPPQEPLISTPPDYNTALSCPVDSPECFNDAEFSERSNDKTSLF